MDHEGIKTDDIPKGPGAGESYMQALGSRDSRDPTVPAAKKQQPRCGIRKGKTSKEKNQENQYIIAKSVDIIKSKNENISYFSNLVGNILMVDLSRSYRTFYIL